jgi:hypothetical protein
MVSDLCFSTLRLYGTCKWKLKKMFWEELLLKWKQFDFQNFHEYQEGTKSTP